MSTRDPARQGREVLFDEVVGEPGAVSAGHLSRLVDTPGEDVAVGAKEVSQGDVEYCTTGALRNDGTHLHPQSGGDIRHVGRDESTPTAGLTQLIDDLVGGIVNGRDLEHSRASQVHDETWFYDLDPLAAYPWCHVLGANNRRKLAWCDDAILGSHDEGVGAHKCW